MPQAHEGVCFILDPSSPRVMLRKPSPYQAVSAGRNDKSLFKGKLHDQRFAALETIVGRSATWTALLGKLFTFSAALWALVAGAYWFLSPQAIYAETAAAPGLGPEFGEEYTFMLSWYEMQGPWGVAVLLIFTAVYVVAGVLAWRDAKIGLAIFSLIALAMTYLAGLSVGGFYLPATLALLVGTALLWISNLANGERNGQTKDLFAGGDGGG